MIEKRGVGRNTIYFTGALVIQKIISFAYFFLLSTRLEPETLGKYVFALSYTSLFSIFIDIGLAPILIREASRQREKSGLYLQNVLAIKIPLSVIVLAILLIIIHSSNRTKDTVELVYLSSLIMMFDAFTINFWSIFRSYQNMFFESVSTILVQCIIFIFGTLALFTSGDIKLIMSALVAASIFNFLFSTILIKTKLKAKLFPKWDKEIIVKLIGLIPIFALSGIFSKIYNTVDSVLLGYLAGEKAVGFYAVPAKFITSLSQLLPASFAAALYPVYSKYFLESKTKLKEIFLNSLKYLIIVSIPISAGLSVLSSDILKIFLPVYVPAQKTFLIMSLAIPFLFLSFSTGYFLNACDMQKYNTVHRGVMAAITIIGNIILIPFYGYLGAGIVFLCVNILVFFLDFARVQSELKADLKDIIKIFFKCIFASAAMIIALFLLREILNIFFVIIISSILYFGILIVLKTASFHNIRKALQI